MGVTIVSIVHCLNRCEALGRLMTLMKSLKTAASSSPSAAWTPQSRRIHRLFSLGSFQPQTTPHMIRPCQLADLACWIEVIISRVPGLAALPWDLPHKQTPHIPFGREGRTRGEVWGDGAGEKKKAGGTLGRRVARIAAARAENRTVVRVRPYSQTVM